MTTDEAIGRVITAEMKRQGLSLTALGGATEIRITTLHQIIRGQVDPRFSTVGKILHGLGRSWAWLDREMRHHMEPAPTEQPAATTTE